MATNINWDNTLWNLAYSHNGIVDVGVNIYRSSFRNVISLVMPQFQLKGPSSFATNGFNLDMGHINKKGRISEWKSGLKF